MSSMLSARGRPAQPSGGHLPALDGLRGVAILFVMLFHYVCASEYGAGSVITRAMVGVASAMWTGVDLFFVLSGFLITGILLRAKNESGYFTTFYMRRVLRIFPLYFAGLAAVFLILPKLMAFDTPGLQRLLDTQAWNWAYAQNLAMAYYREDIFNPDWLWIGHCWSLAVEEHFYMLWPLLVFALSRRTLRTTTIALILAVPVLRFAMLGAKVFFITLYVLTPCRMDELLLGGLLAILAQEWRYERLRTAGRYGMAIATVYFVVIALMGHRFDWTHWTMTGVGFSALGVFYGGVLIEALNPENTLYKRVLQNRALTTFGKYSYGAYLFHTPLQPVYLRYFHPAKIAEASGLGHHGSQIFGLLAHTALGIGITMGLAMVSYHAFEKHFLKLKRYFEYGAPRAVPDATEA